MAYSELVKSFAGIRSYIREFYVYGFRHRTEIGAKSPRSYDNERRRVESWLGEYMHFDYDADGKRNYLSLDSRHLKENPLYKVFQTKSFTSLDIWLHFCLMDLLSEEDGMNTHEILDILETDYMTEAGERYIDESTLRKKLKEYVSLGLVNRKKNGREVLYTKAMQIKLPEHIMDALAFFSETAPLGLVGSYFTDGCKEKKDLIRYKHHHILYALDSEILYDLLKAIQNDLHVKIRMVSGQELCIRPLRIYISSRYGRQYVLAHTGGEFGSFRLDRIDKVKIKDACTEKKKCKSISGEEKMSRRKERIDLLHQADRYVSHMWGMASGKKSEAEHVELVIRASEAEDFILERIRQEKRCGQVRRLDGERVIFTADVRNPGEMLPWIRTFIGRIERFKCSDPTIAQRLEEDIHQMFMTYRSLSNTDTEKIVD